MTTGLKFTIWVESFDNRFQLIECKLKKKIDLLVVNQFLEKKPLDASLNSYVSFSKNIPENVSKISILPNFYTLKPKGSSPIDRFFQTLKSFGWWNVCQILPIVWILDVIYLIYCCLTSPSNFISKSDKILLDYLTNDKNGLNQIERMISIAIDILNEHHNQYSESISVLKKSLVYNQLYSEDIKSFFNTIGLDLDELSNDSKPLYFFSGYYQKNIFIPVNYTISKQNGDIIVKVTQLHASVEINTSITPDKTYRFKEKNDFLNAIKLMSIIFNPDKKILGISQRQRSLLKKEGLFSEFKKTNDNVDEIIYDNLIERIFILKNATIDESVISSKKKSPKLDPIKMFFYWIENESSNSKLPDKSVFAIHIMNKAIKAFTLNQNLISIEERKVVFSNLKLQFVKMTRALEKKLSDSDSKKFLNEVKQELLKIEISFLSSNNDVKTKENLLLASLNTTKINFSVIKGPFISYSEISTKDKIKPFSKNLELREKVYSIIHNSINISSFSDDVKSIADSVNQLVDLKDYILAKELINQFFMFLPNYDWVHYSDFPYHKLDQISENLNALTMYLFESKSRLEFDQMYFDEYIDLCNVNFTINQLALIKHTIAGNFISNLGGYPYSEELVKEIKKNLNHPIMVWFSNSGESDFNECIKDIYITAKVVPEFYENVYPIYQNYYTFSHSERLEKRFKKILRPCSKHYPRLSASFITTDSIKFTPPKWLMEKIFGKNKDSVNPGSIDNLTLLKDKKNNSNWLYYEVKNASFEFDSIDCNDPQKTLISLFKQIERNESKKEKECRMPSSFIDIRRQELLFKLLVFPLDGISVDWRFSQIVSQNLILALKRVKKFFFNKRLNRLFNPKQYYKELKNKKELRKTLKEFYGAVFSQLKGRFKFSSETLFNAELNKCNGKDINIFSDSKETDNSKTSLTELMLISVFNENGKEKQESCFRLEISNNERFFRKISDYDFYNLHPENIGAYPIGLEYIDKKIINYLFDHEQANPKIGAYGSLVAAFEEDVSGLSYEEQVILNTLLAYDVIDEFHAYNRGYAINILTYKVAFSGLFGLEKRLSLKIVRDKFNAFFFKCGSCDIKNFCSNSKDIIDRMEKMLDSSLKLKKVEVYCFLHNLLMHVGKVPSRYKEDVLIDFILNSKNSVKIDPSISLLRFYFFKIERNAQYFFDELDQKKITAILFSLFYVYDNPYPDFININIKNEFKSIYLRRFVNYFKSNNEKMKVFNKALENFFEVDFELNFKFSNTNFGVLEFDLSRDGKTLDRFDLNTMTVRSKILKKPKLLVKLPDCVYYNPIVNSIIDVKKILTKLEPIEGSVSKFLYKFVHQGKKFKIYYNAEVEKFCFCILFENKEYFFEQISITDPKGFLLLINFNGIWINKKNKKEVICFYKGLKSNEIVNLNINNNGQIEHIFTKDMLSEIISDSFKIAKEIFPCFRKDDLIVTKNLKTNKIEKLFFYSNSEISFTRESKLFKADWKEPGWYLDLENNQSVQFFGANCREFLLTIKNANGNFEWLILPYQVKYEAIHSLGKFELEKGDILSEVICPLKIYFSKSGELFGSKLAFLQVAFFSFKSLDYNLAINWLNKASTIGFESELNDKEIELVKNIFLDIVQSSYSTVRANLCALKLLLFIDKYNNRSFKDEIRHFGIDKIIEIFDFVNESIQENPLNKELLIKEGIYFSSLEELQIDQIRSESLLSVLNKTRPQHTYSKIAKIKKSDFNKTIQLLMSINSNIATDRDKLDKDFSSFQKYIFDFLDLKKFSATIEVFSFIRLSWCFFVNIYLNITNAHKYASVFSVLFPSVMEVEIIKKSLFMPLILLSDKRILPLVKSLAVLSNQSLCLKSLKEYLKIRKGVFKENILIDFWTIWDLISIGEISKEDLEFLKFSSIEGELAELSELIDMSIWILLSYQKQISNGMLSISVPFILSSEFFHINFFLILNSFYSFFCNNCFYGLEENSQIKPQDLMSLLEVDKESKEDGCLYPKYNERILETKDFIKNIVLAYEAKKISYTEFLQYLNGVKSILPNDPRSLKAIINIESLLSIKKNSFFKIPIISTLAGAISNSLAFDTKDDFELKGVYQLIRSFNKSGIPVVQMREIFSSKKQIVELEKFLEKDAPLCQFNKVELNVIHTIESFDQFLVSKKSLDERLSFYRKSAIQLIDQCSSEEIDDIRLAKGVNLFILKQERLENQYKSYFNPKFIIDIIREIVSQKSILESKLEGIFIEILNLSEFFELKIQKKFQIDELSILLKLDSRPLEIQNKIKILKEDILEPLCKFYEKGLIYNQLLDQKITDYLFCLTHLQQITQAFDCSLKMKEVIEDITKNKSNELIKSEKKAEYRELSDYLIDKISYDYFRHDYSSDQTQMYSRSYLVFEAKKSIIIRQEQKLEIEALIVNKNALREFRMGLGKSTVIFPVVSKILSKMGKFTCLIVSNELFEQTKEHMDRNDYFFHYSRKSSEQVEDLVKLYQDLLLAFKNQQTVVTTVSAISAVENKIIEFFHKLNEIISSDRPSKDELSLAFPIYEKLHYLQSIDSLFDNKKTCIIADEADDNFKISLEKNYSFDTPKSLSKIGFSVVNDIFFSIYSDKDLEPLRELIDKDQLPTLSEEEIKIFMEQIALKIILNPECRWIGRLIDNSMVFNQKEFVDYLIGRSIDRPDFIITYDKAKQEGIEYLAQKLACYKHFMTKTFPTIASKKQVLDFGFTLTDPKTKGIEVVPKKLQKELPNTKFGHEMELIGYHFLAYAFQSISYEKFCDIYKEICQLACSVKDEYSIEWLRTFDDLDKETEDEQEFMLACYEKFSAFENAKIRMGVLYHLMQSEDLKIHIYRKQIVRNVQDTMNLRSVAGASGTVNSYSLLSSFETYEKHIPKQVTAESIIKILMGEKEGLDAKVDSFVNLQQDILLNLNDFNCKAIIIQGCSDGLLDPVSFIKNLRKEVSREFIFIHPFEKTPYIWRERSESPVRFNKATDYSLIDLKKVVFIFYPSDTRGTDFKIPNGYGRLYLGPTTTQSDMEQAAWRLRKLGSGQKIKIAIEESLARILIEDISNLKIRDVLNYIKLKTKKTDCFLNLKKLNYEPESIVKSLVEKELFKPLNESIAFDENQFLTNKKYSKQLMLKLDLYKKYESFFIKDKNFEFSLRFDYESKADLNLEEYISKIYSDKQLSMWLCDSLLKHSIDEKLEARKYSIIHNIDDHKYYLPEKISKTFFADQGSEVTIETEIDQEVDQQIDIEIDTEINTELFLKKGMPIEEVPFYEFSMSKSVINPCSLNRSVDFDKLYLNSTSTNLPIGVLTYSIDQLIKCKTPQALDVFLVSIYEVEIEFRVVKSLYRNIFIFLDPLTPGEIEYDYFEKILIQNYIPLTTLTKTQISDFKFLLETYIARARVELGYTVYSPEQKIMLEYWAKLQPKDDLEKFIIILAKRGISEEVLSLIRVN